MLGGHLALLGIGCEGCHRDCSIPVGIMRDGDVVSRHGVDKLSPVIHWPSCPLRWSIIRPWGQGALSLSDILRFNSRPLHAGGLMLWREYERIKDLPPKLAEAYHAGPGKN